MSEGTAARPATEKNKMGTGAPGVAAWPELPEAAWAETRTTLQLWAQIVGKIRLGLMPALNHSWSVTLYPTARGWTTGPMWHRTTTVQIDFDFAGHKLVIDTSTGEQRTIALRPMTVAAFYREVMGAMAELDVPVRIWDTPMEMEERIPFHEDETHKAYDAEYVERFWQSMLQATRVMTVFRAGFIGKVSPVHLFWGALDLACTRFSGRRAPEHPSMAGLPDRVTRDAYSHEVSSCGFWPGGGGAEAMFYSYAYPEPPGYPDWPLRPAAAAYNKAMGEFVLPYEAVRTAEDPDALLLDFLESTYDAAANRGEWNRAELERPSKPA